MAKKNAPVVVAATASLNLALLHAIATSMTQSPGYMHVSPADLAPLQAAGYVDVNADPAFMKDGNFAVRLNETGSAFAAANPAVAPAAPETATAPFGAPAAPAAPVAPVAEKITPASFKLVKFEMPDAEKRGHGARPEKYPFSTMEIGDAFFIAATAEVPNPTKAYASTVTSATNRFAEELKDQPMITTAKGKQKYKTRMTRKFVIRAMADGASFGFPGVAGAAVGRVPL